MHLSVLLRHKCMLRQLVLPTYMHASANRMTFSSSTMSAGCWVLFLPERFIHWSIPADKRARCEHEQIEKGKPKVHARLIAHTGLHRTNEICQTTNHIECHHAQVRWNKHPKQKPQMNHTRTTNRNYPKHRTGIEGLWWKGIEENKGKMKWTHNTSERIKVNGFGG